jgi:hypothetical protein
MEYKIVREKKKIEDGLKVITMSLCVVCEMFGQLLLV